MHGLFLQRSLNVQSSRALERITAHQPTVMAYLRANAGIHVRHPSRFMTQQPRLSVCEEIVQKLLSWRLPSTAVAGTEAALMAQAAQVGASMALLPPLQVVIGHRVSRRGTRTLWMQYARPPWCDYADRFHRYVKDIEVEVGDGGESTSGMGPEAQAGARRCRRMRVPHT